MRECYGTEETMCRQVFEMKICSTMKGQREDAQLQFPTT